MTDPTPPALPHNIEAEQAVLGSVLLNPDVLDRLPGLAPEMFFDAVHGRIFELCQTLTAKGQQVSPVRVKPYLAEDEGLKELGGVPYLARLVDAVASLTMAPDYAREIRDLYVRREIMRTADEISGRAASFDPDTPVSALLTGAEDAFAGLVPEIEQRAPSTDFSAAVGEAMSRAEEAFKADGKPRLSTGLEKLDQILGGFRQTQHIVVAARTSMGKTALALSLARNVARPALPDTPGRGVVIVSLEMSKGEVASRLVSTELHRAGKRMAYSRIDHGRFSEDEFREVLQAAAQIERLPIVTLDDGVHDLPRIRSEVRRTAKLFEHRRTPLELVIVDYLQIVGVPGARHTAERVATAAIEMKRLAKELGCTVISVSQVKREVEAADNKRPTLADLRWAGELEESANAVLMLYRPAYYLERDARAESDPHEKAEKEQALREIAHDCEVIVEKNRGGPLGTANLWCDIQTNRFEDYAPGPDNVAPMKGFL